MTANTRCPRPIIGVWTAQPHFIINPEQLPWPMTGVKLGTDVIQPRKDTMLTLFARGKNTFDDITKTVYEAVGAAGLIIVFSMSVGLNNKFVH